MVKNRKWHVALFKVTLLIALILIVGCVWISSIIYPRSGLTPALAANTLTQRSRSHPSDAQMLKPLCLSTLYSTAHKTLKIWNTEQGGEASQPTRRKHSEPASRKIRFATKTQPHLRVLRSFIFRRLTLLWEILFAHRRKTTL